MLIGCPARGADAVRMLRTMVGAALACGRVCVFVEPIALYMTRDLYTDGDEAWLDSYPEPGDSMPLGEVSVTGEGTDLCIASYANGLHMSLQVAAQLASEGVGCRVVDLRWLQPLPLSALQPHAEACGRLLVVDECRASSGIADAVVAGVTEASEGRVLTGRVVGADCYIPLGPGANAVLVQPSDIEAGARQLLSTGATRQAEAS